MLHQSRIFTGYLLLYLLAAFGFTFGSFRIDTAYLWLVLVFVVIFWRVKIVRYLLLAILIVLFANYQFSPRYYPDDPKITGVMVEEPKETGNNQIVLIENPQKQRISAFVPPYPKLELGDTVTIEGEPIPFKDDPYYKDNPGHFYNNRIDYSVKKASVIEVGKETTNLYLKSRRQLIKLRKEYENVLLKALPQPQSGLGIGILLGNRRYLSDSINNIFIATGIVHILALSGFNITVIAGNLEKLIKRRSARLSFWFAFWGIWIFVAATGLSASVVRAAIMGSVMIIAKRLGRQSDSLVGIIAAAALMVLFNPYILRYDIGFQLSFAAMTGMIFLAPLLMNTLTGLGKRFSEIMATTLAAQLFTFPLLSYHFGRITLIGLLANILVLPFIPFVMILVFVCATLSFLSVWLAQKLAFVLWVFLSYIIKVAEVLAVTKLPKTDFQVTPIIMLGLYLILLELVVIWRRGAKVEKS